MLKKFSVSALILAVISMLLTSCGVSQNGSNSTYSFTDSAGYNVTVGNNLNNVAVLFSSLADIWCSAGGSVDITVGESVERGFAEEDAVLVDSSAGKQINIESLLAASPDFVICSADISGQVEAAEQLRQAGIAVALFHVEAFDEYLAALKIFTDITGRSDLFEQNGTVIKNNIDDILSQISSQKPDVQKRILFIRSGSGASSAKAKTADEHFAAKMLEELGTYNIADNAPVLLDGLSIEEIMREDPDEIFIATMGDEEAAKAYMNSVIAEKTWQSLTAVKDGNVIYLPKELFQFKPNSHWDDAYLFLANLLYPEIELNAKT